MLILVVAFITVMELKLGSPMKTVLKATRIVTSANGLDFC